MSDPNEYRGLRFACECVSAQNGYSDPWASISQKKLLPDGTKESIINSVAKEPKTIAQLAKELDLSQPSIHRHVSEMMASELLRESSEWERKYPSERYYEPNFPVVKADERAEFEVICQEMAARVADLFEKRRKQLENAFDKTDLANRGWTFADITQYLYASLT
jgi:DNA-binding transcriptional ArsR family regulator